jgi:hypothetical protein
MLGSNPTTAQRERRKKIIGSRLLREDDTRRETDAKDQHRTFISSLGRLFGRGIGASDMSVMVQDREYETQRCGLNG